ncbi:MAG: helix-turn-helix domain-containing protein [Actinomycetota bacterium]
MTDRMLEALGFTTAEEEVYRLVLEHPGSTVKELSEAGSLASTEIRRGISVLEPRGLVNPSADRPPRLYPSPPEAALEILVLERQEELEAVRVHAAGLAALVRSSLQRTRPGELIEVIDTTAAVGQRFDQIRRAAKQELLIFDKPPYLVSSVEVNDLHMELLERGVECRSIYDRSSLEMTGKPELIATYVERGQQARVFDGIPVKMAIVDRRVGLIPLNVAKPGSGGAVQVHASALLDALAMFFETIWERAAPIQSAPAEGAVPTAGQDSSRVLELMAMGLKDQTIARELGISERTLDRRISEILQSLGARTRFQAGVLAGQRGWIG